jgi:hypothetical protein
MKDFIGGQPGRGNKILDAVGNSELENNYKTPDARYLSTALKNRQPRLQHIQKEGRFAHEKFLQLAWGIHPIVLHFRKTIVGKMVRQKKLPYIKNQSCRRFYDVKQLKPKNKETSYEKNSITPCRCNISRDWLPFQHGFNQQ